MNMLTQVQCPPDLDLTGLQDFINSQESRRVRFNNISESGHSPAPNILTLSVSDVPIDLAPIVLKQVPPDLEADAAGKLIDELISQGYQPDNDHFYDVNVPGGEITVIPFRKEQLPPTNPGSQGGIKTLATVFGLNMDGSIDAEDNGVGSPILGSINTRDPHLVGASIPIAVAKAQFGALASVRGHQVEVTHLANAAKIVAPIVDFGPSVAQVMKGMALDLTLGAQIALGGNGKIPVEYRFV
jgi:hypothetical protein